LANRLTTSHAAYHTILYLLYDYHSPTAVLLLLEHQATTQTAGSEKENCKQKQNNENLSLHSPPHSSPEVIRKEQQMKTEPGGASFADDKPSYAKNPMRKRANPKAKVGKSAGRLG
jgi:hypothetical protein